MKNSTENMLSLIITDPNNLVGGEYNESVNYK